MAKTYIDIVKYMVEARFEISGLVDKPDIIGAVFGQTEGLLGGNLDLRELQKNGKIGRIEIESSASGSYRMQMKNTTQRTIQSFLRHSMRTTRSSVAGRSGWGTAMCLAALQPACTQSYSTFFTTRG